MTKLRAIIVGLAALWGSFAYAQTVVLGTGVAVVPTQAAAAGYNIQTFNCPFNSITVATGGGQPAATCWYLWNFFGNTTTPNTTAVINADGSMTVNGGSGGLNGQIATAAVTSTFVNNTTPQTWHGTAFGGGAYFEYTLKFNPTAVNTANGWPSAWMMSIEHLAELSTQQWTGQAAGYSHFAEVDVLEASIGYSGNANGGSYSSNLWDWYGVFQSTCSPNAYCNYNVNGFRNPAITPDSNYHRYGYLWIPATATTSGSGSFYIDDVLVATSGGQINPVTWSQFTTQSPPPVAPFGFGIQDQQHLVPIMGTGSSSPITILSMKVWQASRAGNLVQ